MRTDRRDRLARVFFGLPRIIQITIAVTFVVLLLTCTYFGYPDNVILSTAGTLGIFLVGVIWVSLRWKTGEFDDLYENEPL